MKPHIGSEVNLIQPQYKYELFHINFTSFHYTGRYELIKLTSLPMCGFIAQLVEHRTGIAEVTGSNPVEALIFFRLLLSNCLSWKFTAMITLHFQCTLFIVIRFTSRRNTIYISRDGRFTSSYISVDYDLHHEVLRFNMKSCTAWRYSEVRRINVES